MIRHTVINASFLYPLQPLNDFYRSLDGPDQKDSTSLLNERSDLAKSESRSSYGYEMYGFSLRFVTLVIQRSETSHRKYATPS